MKCLCNKNVPRVARGNNFTLIVELRQIVISDDVKEITTQIEGTVGNVNICPSNGAPVEWNDWQVAQTSNGAAVAINIPSTQPLGAYGIEITGTRTGGGGTFRWYAKPGEGFIIVDASSDNYLTDMVRIYTITGVVGVGSSGGGVEQVQADWDQTNTSAKDYIKNKPTIPAAQVQADWDQTNTDAKDYIKNKPTIPAAQVQADWDQTNTSAKDYIKNKPTIPAVQVQADWDQTDTSAKDYIKNKPTIPAAQIQADWSQTNTEAKDFIKNKPTIPDVPSWAMQPTKPSYSASEVGALSSSTRIPSKTSDLINDSGFLTQHQSLANYEQKMGIIANPALVSNTLAIPISQLGSYYRLVVSVPTTITLPDMANETVMTIVGVIVNITLSTGGSLTLTATQPIYENGLSDIEEGATFEINAIYNGSYWAVTVTKLELYNPS